MVGRKHRPLISAGEENGTGIRIVHFWSVARHQRQNRHRCRVLDLHAIDQFAEAVERRALVFNQVRGFSHSCTGDDKIAASGKNLSRSPRVMRV